MIEKSFSKHNPMTYQKRYKCPKCGEYSLWISMDIVSECSNCDVDLSVDEIGKVISEDDFTGYYERQELEDSFYFSINSLDAIFGNAGMMESQPLAIKKKDNDKIDALYKRTDSIDQCLDDFVSAYKNRNPKKKDDEFDDFDYLITIVEEVNYFLNLVCKDINLFDGSISQRLLYSDLNYSGMFYANNAIDHLFQANERVYVVLGIMTGYSFSEDFSKNTSWHIKEHLKKQYLYKQNYKKNFDELSSNNSYQQLKEMRNYDEHDFTYGLKPIVEGKIDTSQDRRKIDKEIFEPLLKDYIFCVNKLYDILEQIIKDIGNINASSLIEIPMRNKYLQDDIYVKKPKSYDKSFYEKLEEYRNDLGKKLEYFGRNIRIADVYFRLDEVCHCIRDIYCGEENTTIAINGYEGFVDEEYIIYSALIRIYSCYDKIAKYLSTIYPAFKDVKYFEDLREIQMNELIYRHIKAVLENESYKLLHVIRNMIYHNIRFGTIFGKKTQVYYLNCCIQVVFENTYMLYEFLEKIKPIKKIRLRNDYGGNKEETRVEMDIERNSPCPCGSGRKYKKCCMGNKELSFNGINRLVQK